MALLRSFLAAYSSNSFDAFWRFRTPTGLYNIEPFFDGYYNNFREMALQLSPAPKSIRDDSSSPALERLRTFWKICDEIQRSGAKYRGKPISLLPCSDCLTGVSLKNLEIVPGRDRSGLPDLKEMVDARENNGVFISNPFVLALPDFHSATAQSNSPPAVLTLIFPIRMRSGTSHTVFLAAYWDSKDRCYIPAGLAVPSTAASRALFLF
jgi:hypothetical protein